MRSSPKIRVRMSREGILQSISGRYCIVKVVTCLARGSETPLILSGLDILPGSGKWVGVEPFSADWTCAPVLAGILFRQNGAVCRLPGWGSVLVLCADALGARLYRSLFPGLASA